MIEREFCLAVSKAIADYLWQELRIHPRRGDFRIVSATSGPRVFTLGVVVNPAHAKKVMGLGEQLSMAAGLDRQATIRATRGHQGTLALEIPKPAKLWYNIGIDALPPGKGLRTPIGIDVDHRPARVDFGNPLTPHLLTAGTTGSGKTNSARLFVYDLAKANPPDDLQLLLVDTRKMGMAWQQFDALPHLAHPVITDDEEAFRALGWAVAEMGRRARSRCQKPRLFLCIDEAQALLDRDEFIKPIGNVAAVGREFGIHLLLATQNPTAQMLGDTTIKRNLTTRLVGKVDSAQAAQVAAGIKETGAELLTGPGDQLLISPGSVRRITTALVTGADLGSLPRSETVASLDLDQYQDLDHITQQAGKRTVAPLEPYQVARALALDRGINWLARTLQIGTKRATRLKRFSDELRLALEDLGYTLIPHTPETSVSGVTGETAAEGV